MAGLVQDNRNKGAGQRIGRRFLILELSLERLGHPVDELETHPDFVIRWVVKGVGLTTLGEAQADIARQHEDRIQPPG